VKFIKIFDDAILQGIAPGLWVAISRDQERVVATGVSIEETLEKSEQHGEPQPFIFRIPKADSAMIL